jgi:putative thioredoxin
MADSPYIIEVTDANFATTVIEQSRQVPVLVDFWAEWCQPCKMLMPVLAALANEYGGKFILAKVNTEEQQGVAGQFGIRSIPTVKLFIDGQPVDEFAGALPESSVREFLDRHLPREEDPIVAKALMLMEQDDLAGAGELLEAALEQNPSNVQALLANARLLLVQGAFDQAEQQLEAIPLDQQDNEEAVQLRAQLPFLKVLQDAPPMEEVQARAEQGDSHARYQLAAALLFQNQVEASLEAMFALMQSDRKYGDDAARKGMLAIFDMLGSDEPLVKTWRNRMFAALH